MGKSCTPVGRLGRRFSVALACVVITTGCSQSGGSDGAVTDQGPAYATGGNLGEADRSKWPSAQATSGLTKGLTLPIQTYLVSYSQQVTVLRAQHSVQKECMKKLGFEYNPSEPGHFPPPSADDANMLRRYGVADLEQAREYGYRLPNDSGEPPVDAEISDAANAALMGRTSSGEKVTTPGVPADGCLGESERRIGTLDGTLASRLNNEGFDASKASPKVRAVVQKWSSCMQGKGYTVTTPLEAANLVDSQGSGSASSSETDVAVADVECKKSTDLVPVWFEEETRIQNELIEKNQLALQEAKRKAEAALKNATRAAAD